MSKTEKGTEENKENKPAGKEDKAAAAAPPKKVDPKVRREEKRATEKAARKEKKAKDNEYKAKSSQLNDELKNFFTWPSKDGEKTEHKVWDTKTSLVAVVCFLLFWFNFLSPYMKSLMISQTSTPITDEGTHDLADAPAATTTD